MRLRVMSALVSVHRLAFTELRDAVGATDGNLATHLRKLEEARYISVTKQFVGRKPLTTYAVTPGGREAFSRYVDVLQALLP